MGKWAIHDGTPHYRESVREGHHKLQIRTSVNLEQPKCGSGIRLGIYQVQAHCGKGATDKNMLIMEEAVKRAEKFNVQLLAFPELFVTGYTMGPDDVKNVSETSDGKSISLGCDLAREFKMAIILPYSELIQRGDSKKYYDSIAVINEHGELLDSYRKTHLYGQQERDNFSAGESDYPVHPINGFPVGVLNCYECEFPELVRILALKGAKLVVGPTAADTYYRLPSGDRSHVPYPDVSKTLLPAFAYANNIFYAYANRCGFEERDGDIWHYRGNSIVCGPHGDFIVEAAHEQDTMLIADCVPAYYGHTHPAPDYFYLKDRRPELYSKLVAGEAEFLNTVETPAELNTNFLEGGYKYQ